MSINKVLLGHSHAHSFICYGFCATSAELSSCSRHHVARKPENIFYLVLYRQSFANPCSRLIVNTRNITSREGAETFFLHLKMPASSWRKKSMKLLHFHLWALLWSSDSYIAVPSFYINIIFVLFWRTESQVLIVGRYFKFCHCKKYFIVQNSSVLWGR